MIAEIAIFTVQCDSLRGLGNFKRNYIYIALNYNKLTLKILS